jgi:hypothetical protein
VGHTTMMMLTDLGLPPPHGFDLEERGMKECSERYLYGDGYDPLQKGEMVRQCSGAGWGRSSRIAVSS